MGIAGVATGALGAHALAERLEAAGRTQVWETAVIYHLVHTLALLALAVGAHSQPLCRPWRWAGGCWILGILAFSGSLYVLSLGGPRWLGPITPIGGLVLMVGWAAAAWGFQRQRPTI
jgi:uncharacterized membrane protein YgdD (TMEM256/DUF423 family)